VWVPSIHPCWQAECRYSWRVPRAFAWSVDGALSRQGLVRHAGIVVIREQARRDGDHEVVETP
jgi:hypothetical protein